jgi:pimeloyl-ACP methyl ester carboxylesterase
MQAALAAPERVAGLILLDALEQLVMPVLVAVGERDVPGFREMAAVLARRIPGAQYRIVTGAGHMINMEQPAAVNELLARFLDQLPPAAATAPVH